MEQFPMKLWKKNLVVNKKFGIHKTIDGPKESRIRRAQLRTNYRHLTLSRQTSPLQYARWTHKFLFFE
jgi:hypothetical protein